MTEKLREEQKKNEATREKKNAALTRKEELNRVRGQTKWVDPERGPENKG